MLKFLFFCAEFLTCQQLDVSCCNLLIVKAIESGGCLLISGMNAMNEIQTVQNGRRGATNGNFMCNIVVGRDVNHN